MITSDLELSSRIQACSDTELYLGMSIVADCVAVKAPSCCITQRLIDRNKSLSMRMLWLKALEMMHGFAPPFRQRAASAAAIDPNIMSEVARVRHHLRKIRQDMGLRPLPDQRPNDPKLFLEMAKLWMPEIFQNIEAQRIPSTSMTSTLLPPNERERETLEDICGGQYSLQTLRNQTEQALPHPQCITSRIFGISPILHILPSGTGSMMTPLCLKWYQDAHVQHALNRIPSHIICYYPLGNQGESSWSHPSNVSYEFSNFVRKIEKFAAVSGSTSTLRPQLCLQNAGMGGDMTPSDKRCTLVLTRSSPDAARLESWIPFHQGQVPKLLPPFDEFLRFRAFLILFPIGEVLQHTFNSATICKIQVRFLICIKASRNMLQPDDEREGSLGYVIDIDHPRKRRMLSSMANFTLSYSMTRAHATTRRQSTQAAARILGTPVELAPVIQEEDDDAPLPPSPSSTPPDDVEDATESQNEEEDRAVQGGQREDINDVEEVQEAANILLAATPHPAPHDNEGEQQAMPRPHTPILDLNYEENQDSEDMESDEEAAETQRYRDVFSFTLLEEEHYELLFPDVPDVLTYLANDDSRHPVMDGGTFVPLYKPNMDLSPFLRQARLNFFLNHTRHLTNIMTPDDRLHFLTKDDARDLLHYLQQGGEVRADQRKYIYNEFARAHYSDVMKTHYSVQQFAATKKLWQVMRDWDHLHVLNYDLALLPPYTALNPTTPHEESHPQERVEEEQEGARAPLLPGGKNNKLGPHLPQCYSYHLSFVRSLATLQGRGHYYRVLSYLPTMTSTPSVASNCPALALLRAACSLQQALTRNSTRAGFLESDMSVQ